MARPLKADSLTTPVSLKEISNTEIAYISHRILEQFVVDELTGMLYVNPGSNSGMTLIGTFTDTYRNHAVGAHPVGTEVVSETYEFFQNLQTYSEDVNANSRPMQYDSSTGLNPQANTDLENYIISVTANTLVNGGIGMYKLQPTSPSDGTWISRATITDKANIGFVGSSNTYLWQKTANTTTPTTIRSLTYKTDKSGLIEMSDTQIKNMAPLLRKYIRTTGIGKYALQTAAPGTGGTWVLAGQAFSDTRHSLGNQSYSGNYTGAYVPAYTGFYAASYSGSYSRAFSGVYAGGYARFFAGFLNGYYVGNYTGFYTGFFTGAYSGPSYSGNYVGLNYTGTYSQNFTGAYAGTYAGNYTGAYARFFAGFLNGYYSGTYTGYYTGYYSGTYSQNFSGTYAGITYSGTYTGSYTGQTVLATKDTVSTVSLWIRTA